jgi:hypothetical protein
MYVDYTGKFLLISFQVTATFLEAGLRPMKEGNSITILAAQIERGILKIGIDYIEKRVAQVGYNLLVRELSALAATSGAAGVQLRGFIASPGGQRFFERVAAMATKEGFTVEMQRNNNFMQLYWYWETMQ